MVKAFLFETIGSWSEIDIAPFVNDMMDDDLLKIIKADELALYILACDQDFTKTLFLLVDEINERGEEGEQPPLNSLISGLVGFEIYGNVLAYVSEYNYARDPPERRSDLDVSFEELELLIREVVWDRGNVVSRVRPTSPNLERVLEIYRRLGIYKAR